MTLKHNKTFLRIFAIVGTFLGALVFEYSVSMAQVQPAPLAPVYQDPVRAIVAFTDRNSNGGTDLLFSPAAIPGGFGLKYTIYSAPAVNYRILDFRQNYSQDLDPNFAYFDYLLEHPSTPQYVTDFVETKVDLRNYQIVSSQTLNIALAAGENVGGSFDAVTAKLAGQRVTLYAYNIMSSSAMRMEVRSLPSVRGPYIINLAYYGFGNAVMNNVQLRTEHDAQGNTTRINVYFVMSTSSFVYKMSIDPVTNVVSSPQRVINNVTASGSYKTLKVGEQYMVFPDLNRTNILMANSSSAGTWTPAVPVANFSYDFDLLKDEGGIGLLVSAGQYPSNWLREQVFVNGGRVRDTTHQFPGPVTIVSVALPEKLPRDNGVVTDKYLLATAISNPVAGTYTRQLQTVVGGVLQNPIFINTSTYIHPELEVDILR